MGGPTTLFGTSISASTLGGDGAQVDDGHGVGRRAPWNLDLAVDQLDLGVVGRDRELRVSRGASARQHRRAAAIAAIDDFHC